VRRVGLQDLLAPYGATNEDKVAAISVPLYIGWNGNRYGDAFVFLYKAKAGRTGTAK
jgi:hypothetical protein